MALHVIEGPYWRDILDQPRALEETHRRLEVPAGLADVARRLRDGEFARVVLTGMGSSHFGLAPLHLRLVEAGHSPVTVESSELLHYQKRLLAAGTLLVIASQSGRSAEIVRILEAVRGPDVVTVGITNTAASPLAREATANLLTHAGEEATVSCKTYLAAQMALAFLGEVLAGSDPGATREALWPYEQAFRRIFRKYALATRAVLLIAARPRLRRRVVRWLGWSPRAFDALLTRALL